MNGSIPPLEQTSQPVARKEGIEIDFKRVADRALRHWYVVILVLAISLLVAYFKNRYAVRIYPVTASLVIREKQEMSGAAELLYSNSLVNPNRNYLNEPYLVRSYPLIGSVVNDLNFEVAFYKEGNIKTTEAYGLPVKVRLLKRNGSYGSSLQFTVIDDHSYSIKTIGKDGAPEKILQFNDSVVYAGHHFVILKEAENSVEGIKGSTFVLTFLDPQSITSSYVSRLNVSWAEEGAGVLDLSITGANPAKEMDFITGLIKAYQNYDLEKKNQTADRTIHFIQGQLKDISDSLKLFEHKLQDFKITNSSEKLDDEAKRLFEKLTPLEERKMELLMRENYYKYLKGYLNSSRSLDLVVLPSSVGVDDAGLSELITKMTEIQLEVKLFIGKGLTENPMVQTGLKKLDEIKANLLASVEALRAADKIKRDLLAGQIAEIEKQINLLPSTQRQFISIQRNYNLLEGLYVFLMQKMSEAGISKASNVTDILIVNPPMQGGAISPNTSRIYLFGLLFGLFIPLAFFILLEIINHRIQSKEDIEKITKIPFIGGIGHNPYNDNLVVHVKSKSIVAESFRAIRSNLNYFTGNGLKKVFMVSSSISGEGKSFTTINLASVFAMSGRKTLIIGADMRKPKIYNDFNLSNDRGLSGYLSKANTFSEVLQSTNVPNLDLISGGPVPPNPSELLMTGMFDELISEALKMYDYIIIDTPPLAVVTDAFLVAKHADHTVFVVRQNYTHRSFLAGINDFYSTGKLKNISIVLNDIYKTGYGYGSGYGYGYGYGSGYRYGYGKKENGGYYTD